MNNYKIFKKAHKFSYHTDMTQTRKNVIWIILYILITSGLIFLGIKRFDQLGEKIILILLGVANMILYITNIKRIKYFTFIENTLVINQTFSKQKIYNIKGISGWTENHFNLLGIKTAKEIIINIEGIKIKLYERNSKDYEKLSNYLNENFSARYESKANTTTIDL
jgi:hypothetical protein